MNLLYWLARPQLIPGRIAYAIHERRHPSEPWISPAAVRFLDRALSRDDDGLEWGSGRSTAWFGERLRHLTSVEFDRGWYERVRDKVNNMANVELLYLPLDHPATEPTRPDYDPLPKYVAVVDRFGDESLGFVLVDGHYRQACVRAAIPKLKAGGLLAVDNSNTIPLRDWGVPEDWPIVHQSRTVMGQTTVWRKT